MAVKILVNDYPHRSVAIAGPSHALLFHNYRGSKPNGGSASVSLSENESGSDAGQQCAVEFAPTSGLDLNDYMPLSTRPCLGCLGLINIETDVFLCVITGAKEVAQVRPGEQVHRIYGVEFHCLTRSDYDHFLEYEVNAYPVESDGWDQARSQQPPGVEHPCIALKKLLSDGTFYYSGDFDLTNRLQERSVSVDSFDIDSFDSGFMWNSHMINPLLQFRSRLTHHEQHNLDETRFLTCAIRGFVESMTFQRPSGRMEARTRTTGLPAMLTLISRLSCRRAGTRFNARGIDDDGNVANFVETETVVWNPGYGESARPVTFSYCQIRGSVPLFWEQQTGILPNQQKIQITRSPEATQPAFDKHMDGLVLKYWAVHIVNLLSERKSGEAELSARYRKHIRHSPLLADSKHSGHGRNAAALLRSTEYDFHAETKGSAGYEAASQIRHIVEESADGFGYFLAEGRSKREDEQEDNLVSILQQKGAFRTNCLDCLDRTNLVQGIFSKAAIESFLDHRAEIVGHDFWMRHSTLWADNGDALSKIYAGTGALKSSFTRTGKMSLAGAIADARKSATRMYINNFADKDRQNTIDIVLGRLVGQEPVRLYDPINDYVAAELNKRSFEYTTETPIRIHVGTFNLNGQMAGISEDLSDWLAPSFLKDNEEHPELVVVGFQEMVELSPQQIMATDPARRRLWERALLACLNKHSHEPYALLRGGQLVGAALLIFVRSSVIGEIKNVEGGLKKTGMSGVAGNKGAVAIRFDYANTRLCFVTAHLAAGFSNSDERNRDYTTIAKGLRFQRGRKIDDHDTIIWLGDFNYRIGLPDEKVRKLIEIGDLETLHDNDQLHLQMQAGLTFPFYAESQLTFNPTYKYDIGTDIYDTSEKSRIPAWCDRILWKGKELHQLSYGCANIRFSDHRPVFATFQCMVSVVDEHFRDQLSRELYLKRKIAVGDVKGRLSTTLDEDEDDLLDLGPLVPGLPAPSSDKHKWWLNDGLHAKSLVQAPANSAVNPHRPANPFRGVSEPDWIGVGSRTPPADIVGRTGQPPLNTVRKPVRTLPPPFDPSAGPTIPRSGDAALLTRKPLPRSSPAASIKSEPSRKDGKPPVPKKPVDLSQGKRNSLDGQNPTTYSGSTGSVRDAQSGRNIYPPPPRRASTMGSYRSDDPRVNVTRLTTEDLPKLPPRPAVGELMDAEAEPLQLDAWQPLRPL